MDFEIYQKEMKRTANNLELSKDNLSLGAMGISGESGEVTDYLKKVIFHKHELSKEKLAEELGDVLWYITYLASVIDYDLKDIAEMNINKLKSRYPKGFDSDKSINRMK